MDLITIFEYIGLFVFAASGAICAIEKRMDFFGILTLATVTAIGGGVIRDVVTNIGIPVFFSRWEYMLVILISTILVIIFRGTIKWKTSFLILDAIGLAVFTIAAGMKAIELEYNFMTFLFVSLITAVGGGVIRDILARQVPNILKHEIYAVASIIGSICFWFIHPYLGMGFSSYLCLLLIFIIRLVTYYYHLHLPYIENGQIKFKPTQEKLD
ncbi:MAG: trimeric intracellular cation channel family protein [Turicibacter sp.]|nr:trimeric intracellular cation channel family protein [Turicibacter sp.]